MASFFSSLFKKSNQYRPNPKFNYLTGFDAFTKGCNLSDKRQYEEALEYFDYAVYKGIKEAYQERASCLQSLGFFTDSIPDYTKAIEYNPTDCNLYFCRGISKYAIGDFPGAISDKYLAIQYSKIKNDINSKRDEIAKTLMADSITEYYEVYMADWENDLKVDTELRDRIETLKKSGSERDLEVADRLSKTLHVNLFSTNLKRR